MSPLPDPTTAPKRTDLPFLTRRSARRATPSPTVAAFIAGKSGHGAHHERSVQSDPQVSPPTGSLDLSEPPASTPSPGPRPANPLDLSESAPTTAAKPPQNPLDLSAAATPPPPPRAPTPRPPTGPRPRITGDRQRILGVRDPAVWLTRVQSGIGELSIQAVCGPDVGDLRLGALYEFASGLTSTVQFAGGNRFAPSSRRPVLVAGREDYEHLRIDLRQTPELRRLALYAVSESRAELTWGGTLVADTVGGGRIELPLESLHPGRLAVLLSIYNVDGELVVRAEMETVDGDVREAARAYGYDRITWRDERTPVM